MVRKVTIEGNLDFVGPKVAFNILFDNDEFVKKYHKKINYDPHVEVSSWSKSQEREVKYVALMDVPAMFQKLLGESFPVTEVQRFHESSDCYTVTCLPRMQSPSGDNFVTEVETVLASDESGGCAITSHLKLEYCGVWFKGAIENFMEMKARTGFDEWMMLAKLFCQEKLAMTGTPDTNGDEECFFDAEEASIDDTLSTVPDSPTPENKVINQFQAALSESTNESHGLEPYLIRTVLQNSTDIEQLATRLLKIGEEADLARIAWEKERVALKGEVEQLSTKMLRMEDDVAFTRQAWGRQQGMVFERRQSALLSTFVVGFATGAAAGYLYLRSRRQT